MPTQDESYKMNVILKQIQLHYIKLKLYFNYSMKNIKHFQKEKKKNHNKKHTNFWASICNLCNLVTTNEILGVLKTLTILLQKQGQRKKRGKAGGRRHKPTVFLKIN